MITVKIEGRDFKSWVKALKGAGFVYSPGSQTWTGDESRLLGFQAKALEAFRRDAAEAPTYAAARNIDGAQTLAEWRSRRGGA